MINELIERIRSGKSTAVDEVRIALERAKETREYNVFTNLTEERALEKAKEIDEKMAKGIHVGRLAGVPYALKDNYLDFGAPTTASSKMMENFDAPLQSTVVKKLEGEGAICIGRANLDSYAHGGSTENSYFGPTLNAYDKTRVAGGSSGGSAAAVALNIVPFAMGSDTGGSIRQPASYNGVVGVKPTYGTVSRYGVVAMGSSTDTMGCLTSNVEDAEIVMDIIAGKDEKDSNTLDDFFEPLEDAPEHQRIGILKECMTDDVDESVRNKVLGYVDRLKSAGHEVEEVSLPIVKYSLAIYYIVVTAETASNMARYDSVRYGYRDEKAKDLASMYGGSRDEGLMPENKRRIMMGNYVLSSGFYDAYYLKAQKARTLLINEYEATFEKFDALVCPVAPTTAFKLGQNTDDPIKMYLEDAMTVPASMAGLPAISVPAGKTDEGMPVGVQLIGPMKSDAKLLALTKSVEEKR